MQQVVAIGYIGSGKTTLFNKCCNKQQDTQPGGDSVTKLAFLTSSAYGKGFKMLDTPGLGADRQKMDHTIGIANALSEGDVHMILVLIKFDRLALMKKIIREIVEQKLSRFKNLITVAVTFWDSIKQQVQKNQNLQEIQSLRMTEIKDYLTSINVHNSIYISIEDDGQKICQQIDQILKQNTQGQKCILSQTEIVSYFDLIDETEDIQKRLSDTSGKLIKEFSDICKAIKKWINNFDNNHPSLSDIMHQLTIEIKNIAEKTVTDFEMKYMADFYQLYEENEEVIYYIHSKLKAEIVQDVKAVQELAQKKMYNNKLHVYNFIKQCPYCGVIWFKVSGCGNTVCGDFPTADDSQFTQQAAIKRFKFQISSEGVEFQDLGIVSPIKPKSYQLGPSDKLKGCGQPLNWSALKGLDENQIKELCDPGVIDYLSQVDNKMQFKSKKLEDQINVALEKNKVQQI